MRGLLREPIKHSIEFWWCDRDVYNVIEHVLGENGARARARTRKNKRARRGQRLATCSRISFQGARQGSQLPPLSLPRPLDPVPHLSSRPPSRPLALSRLRRSVTPSPRARRALRTPSHVDTRRKRDCRRQRDRTLARPPPTAASRGGSDKETIRNTKTLEKHQGWGSSRSPGVSCFRRGSCPAGYVAERCASEI